MPLQKILLVDDDRAINYLHRIILSDNQVDCKVDEVLTGEDALQYISDTDACPEVILLDINMPGIDGFGFLKEYKQRAKCTDYSKVYMLTSSQRSEDRAEADGFHVNGYFEKPLSGDHIKAILAELN